MFAAIKGYYEEGRIFLEEEAPVESKTEVIITFLTKDAKNTGIQKRVEWIER